MEENNKNNNSFKNFYKKYTMKVSRYDANSEKPHFTCDYETENEEELNRLLKLAGVTSDSQSSGEEKVHLEVQALISNDENRSNNINVHKEEILSIHATNVKDEKDIDEIREILILSGILKPPSDEEESKKCSCGENCSCNGNCSCDENSCNCVANVKNASKKFDKKLEFPDTPYDYEPENIDLRKWKIEKSNILASVPNEQWPTLIDDFVTELVSLGFSRPEAEKEVMDLMELNECVDYDCCRDEPREYHYIGDINRRYEDDLENRYTKAWSADNPLEKGSLEGKLLSRYYEYLKKEYKENNEE